VTFVANSGGFSMYLTNNRKRLSVQRKCPPYMGALAAAGCAWRPWLRWEVGVAG